SRRIDRKPDNARLKHFDAVITTVRFMHDKKVAEAMRMVRALSDEVIGAGMDMEAACNTVALWARLNSQEIQLDEMPMQVTRIARRFCVSRAATEMLTAAAQATEPSATIIRDSPRRHLRDGRASHGSCAQRRAGRCGED